jgi:hypothetical protein
MADGASAASRARPRIFDFLKASEAFELAT